MPTWQRAYLAACAGVTAYCLVYMGVDYGTVPRLFYYQLEHAWRFEARSSGSLPSGYVGLWSWAIAAGLAVGAAAWIALAWRRRPLSSRALALSAAWALTGFGISAAYYTWHNWP